MTAATARAARWPLALAPAAALLALAAAGAHATPSQHATLWPAKPRGPFASAEMEAFMQTRAGAVTAAAYNIKTKRMFIYHPGLHGAEASIAKVDILATALYEAQQRGTTLSSLEQELAAGAIERSNNDDAQALWQIDGGNPAIAAFNARVGMTQTILDPQGVWGLYESTARDQIRLLEHIALHNDVLSDASRNYELGLMHGVESDQAWGVSGGVLAPASVALKNGWLPLGSDWEINSIGQVAGRYRDYLLAVLTSDDPSMAYGVKTIDGISQLVWSYYLPRRFRPSPPAPSGRGI